MPFSAQNPAYFFIFQRLGFLLFPFPDWMMSIWVSELGG